MRPERTLQERPFGNPGNLRASPGTWVRS